MIIKVKVKPNSKKQEIEKISYNKYKVYLKEKAEKGKANLALLKLLKIKFGREISIIKGFKNKDKVIEIK